MNKKRAGKWLLLVMLTIVGVQPAFAEENGFLITGITHADQVVANQPSEIKVTVEKLSTTTSQATPKPAEDAQITLVLTNGSTTLEAKAPHRKNGEYIGEVTFPKVGDWKVSAFAAEVGQQVDVKKEITVEDHSAIEMMVTVTGAAVPKVVSEEQSQQTTQLYILIALLLAGSIFLVVRIRKIMAQAKMNGS